MFSGLNIWHWSASWSQWKSISHSHLSSVASRFWVGLDLVGFALSTLKAIGVILVQLMFRQPYCFITMEGQWSTPSSPWEDSGVHHHHHGRTVEDSLITVGGQWRTPSSPWEDCGVHPHHSGRVVKNSLITMEGSQRTLSSLRWLSAWNKI